METYVTRILSSTLYTYRKSEFLIEKQPNWCACFVAGYGTVKSDTIAGCKFMVRRVVDFMKVKS